MSVRRKREITGEWSDEKIAKLITIVEQRPLLWDSSRSGYRVPKPTVWDEVAAELGEGNIGGETCKMKWQSLRVQFKTNAASAKKNKSGQGTDEVTKVHWRFFKSMQFIEAKEGQVASCSTSNLNLSSDSELPTEVDVVKEVPEVGKRRKKKDNTPPLEHNIKKMTDKALQIMGSNDKYSAFGDHVAAELRSLSKDEAQVLQRRLTITMMDFFDERSVNYY